MSCNHDELWQANVKLKTALAGRSEALARAHQRAETAEAMLALVEALHQRDLNFCREDGFVWPCPTARALDGDA